MVFVLEYKGKQLYAKIAAQEREQEEMAENEQEAGPQSNDDHRVEDKAEKNKNQAELGEDKAEQNQHKDGRKKDKSLTRTHAHAHAHSRSRSRPLKKTKLPILSQSAASDYTVSEHLTLSTKVFGQRF